MLETPTCCIDGCDTPVPGLGDGLDLPDREGIVCNDCFEFKRRHRHYPDEDPETCIECRVDEGAIRHRCSESPADAVVLDPGNECPSCGEVIEDA